jgi:hypothetical protein
MACRRAEQINLEVLFREPGSPECRDLVAHARDCEDCTASLQRRGEPPEETAPKAPSVAVAGAAIVIIAVVALLALSDRSAEAPEPASSQAEQPPTAVQTPAPARATSQRISENGRLSVSLHELPEGEGLALNLAMPVEAHGEGPRQVRVVDVERERLLETTGKPATGADTGLRIEIEPGWLRPGLYMIEVDTAEKKPLALRRFVLELH